MEDLSSPRFLVRYLPPFLLAVGAMMLCWYAAGVTLGLFFGGVFVVTLMAPPLAASRQTLLSRLLAGGAAVDGVGLVLLATAFTSSITLLQCLVAYLVIAIYAASLICLVHLLTQWRVAPLVAGALVMLVAWAWLLWPIWLSVVLTNNLAALLTPTHPLMGINALLRHLGLWSEQAGTIYHLTTLNQDIPHRLPANAWPTIVFHTMLALGSALLAGIGGEHHRQLDSSVDMQE